MDILTQMKEVDFHRISITMIMSINSLDSFGMTKNRTFSASIPLTNFNLHLKNFFCAWMQWMIALCLFIQTNQNQINEQTYRFLVLGTKPSSSYVLVDAN